MSLLRRPARRERVPLRRRTWCATLVLVALAAACSGDDDGESALPSVELTAPSGGVVNPSALQAPVLGGSSAAFDDAFGARALPGVDGTEFATYTYLPCEGQEAPQLSVSFMNGVAWTISYGPCEPRVLRGVGEAESEASAYFPSDTVRLGDFTTQDGEAAASFHSALLAQAFDGQSQIFQDCDASPVEPGTFSIVAMENDWFMGPGTCL